MATDFVAKLWQNYLPPALIALSKTECRLANTGIYSSTDYSTSYEKWLKLVQ